jgi:hypothetical protein
MTTRRGVAFIFFFLALLNAAVVVNGDVCPGSDDDDGYYATIKSMNRVIRKAKGSNETLIVDLCPNTTFDMAGKELEIGDTTVVIACRSMTCNFENGEKQVNVVDAGSVSFVGITFRNWGIAAIQAGPEATIQMRNCTLEVRRSEFVNAS